MWHMLFKIFCLGNYHADRVGTQEKPSDPEVFRLLGEVKYELKDYEGSAAAYKVSSMVSLCKLCTSSTNSHQFYH